MITFKQITIDEWQKGDYRTVASINRTTDYLFSKHKIVFEEYVEEGLGKAKTAAFITSNNNQFLIIEYLEPNIPITEILILNNPDTIARDLREVLKALELSYSDLDWVNENISLI
jgi:hypothetical protein